MEENVLAPVLPPTSRQFLLPFPFSSFFFLSFSSSFAGGMNWNWRQQLGKVQARSDLLIVLYWAVQLDWAFPRTSRRPTP